MGLQKALSVIEGMLMPYIPGVTRDASIAIMSPQIVLHDGSEIVLELEGFGIPNLVVTT